VAFDPRQPLPAAPLPWAPSTMPPARRRPPYLMTDMIAAEPALAERLTARLMDDAALRELVDALRTTADAGRPIVTTGCGTSEHAALALAYILEAALGLPAGRGIRAIQALETLHAPPADGLLLAVSHEGGTWATNEALRAAREAGARTALVTVSDRSPGAAIAEIVVTTDEQDQSWCHTVGYVSPLIVAAVAADVIAGRIVDPHGMAGLLADAADEQRVTAAAERLAGCARLITAGWGIDYVTAREMALKVEEGARLPAVAHQLETVRHGHLAAADETTGVVLIVSDGATQHEQVMSRVDAVARSARVLGMPLAAILAPAADAQIAGRLTPAGRLLLPSVEGLPAAAGAALTAALALQLLTERLARARGVDPDTLGRDDPRQAAAHD
jgi:glutamine---fructose-6-phosphate transaminase (isomerizing)